jgi:hypothetical protein
MAMGGGVLKVIELRGGSADGRRVSVPDGTTEITMADDSARGFDAVQAYRPTGDSSHDGVEVWELYTGWSTSGPAPLM